MGSGATIRSMVMVSFSGQTDASTRENGAGTSSVTEASTHGQMDADMKDSTWMTRSMAGAFINGLMERLTKVIGTMASNMDKENSPTTPVKVELAYGSMVIE